MNVNIHLCLLDELAIPPGRGNTVCLWVQEGEILRPGCWVQEAGWSPSIYPVEVGCQASQRFLAREWKLPLEEDLGIKPLIKGSYRGDGPALSLQEMFWGAKHLWWLVPGCWPCTDPLAQVEVCQTEMPSWKYPLVQANLKWNPPKLLQTRG